MASLTINLRTRGLTWCLWQLRAIALLARLRRRPLGAWHVRYRSNCAAGVVVVRCTLGRGPVPEGADGFEISQLRGQR